MNLDEFLRHYIVAALWASTDDNGEPLDAKYNVEDFAPEAITAMREDCADFIEANAADLAAYTLGTDHAGHDFWLTRNGHGAGFWDRGLGELGDRLAAASKVYGGCDVYAGDDGKLYVS